MLNFPVIPVSIGCFIIAATQNYIINHRWSFRKHTGKTGISFKKWLEFISGSLFGLAVNLLVMNMVLLHFILPYKFIAQGCGIAAGMCINFTISKLFVFRKKEQDHE
jgi:putative flippase GtrA